MTQSELAGVLKLQLPNLVKILSKMEDAGTLKRKRSVKDKRAVELSLTKLVVREERAFQAWLHSADKRSIARKRRKNSLSHLMRRRKL